MESGALLVVLVCCDLPAGHPYFEYSHRITRWVRLAPNVLDDDHQHDDQRDDGDEPDDHHDDRSHCSVRPAAVVVCIVVPLITTLCRMFVVNMPRCTPGTGGVPPHGGCR